MALYLLDNRLHQCAEQGFFIVKVVIKAPLVTWASLQISRMLARSKPYSRKVVLGAGQKIFVCLLKVLDILRPSVLY